MVHIGEQEKYSFDDDLRNLSEKESDLSKVTDILLNDLYDKRKTILTSRQIAPLTTLYTIAKIWDVEFLLSWIPNYCKYMTSKDGKGRSDIVEITKHRLDIEQQRERNMLEAMGNRR